MKVVRLLRLTTGEEIIGKVDEDYDPHNDTVVDNPVIIVPSAEGKLTFMPFIGYADLDKVLVKSEHLMFVVNPGPNMEDSYNQMTGSIHTTKQKIIT
jgi:hypothetical protein